MSPAAGSSSPAGRSLTRFASVDAPLSSEAAPPQPDQVRFGCVLGFIWTRVEETSVATRGSDEAAATLRVCARVCRRVNVYCYFFPFFTCHKNVNKEMEMTMPRSLCKPPARAHGESSNEESSRESRERFWGL